MTIRSSGVGRWLGVMLVMAAGCKEAGVIPITPPPTTAVTWSGTTVSRIDGRLPLVLNLEQGGGRLSGTFAVNGGARSGTVTGSIDTAFAEIVLSQAFPCAARYELSGELLNDGAHLAGLWTSVECDPRTEEGTFTLLRAGRTAAARADVGRQWDVTFRYATARDDGRLALVQDREQVGGLYTDGGGALIGRADGTVTGDVLHLVVEIYSPCPMSRSIAATVAADGKSIAGTWFGPVCDGTTISGARFDASHD